MPEPLKSPSSAKTGSNGSNRLEFEPLRQPQSEDRTLGCSTRFLVKSTFAIEDPVDAGTYHRMQTKTFQPGLHSQGFEVLSSADGRDGNILQGQVLMNPPYPSRPWLQLKMTITE